MHLLYDPKFEITIFLKLAVILSKPLVGNQLANDSKMTEINLTTESGSNVTETDTKYTTEVIFGNYSHFNISSYPVPNITSEENYTVFQDYNETLSNFSYGENITYPSLIDETRLPYTSFSLPCSCDLTGNSCDVNCCCDKECTDRDKDAFFGCIPPFVDIDERHCISKSIIYDHMKIKEKVVEVDGLFCIMQDHLKQRHKYLEPPILKTVTEYEQFVPNPIYSWISTSESIDNGSKYVKRMKAGEPLYVFTVDKVLTKWKLPTSIFSGHCGAFKTPKYMIDDETTCQQIITDVKQACLHNKWLKVKTYYKDFSFATSQFFLFFRENISSESNSTYPSTEEVSIHRCTSNLFCISIIPPHNYTCRDDNDIPQLCTLDDDIPLPEYNAQENTCKNVVSQVYYSIVYNGSIGIMEASVAFETSTINILQKSVSQRFIVRYYGTKDARIFRRSGNPGYLVGHPILAGNIGKLPSVILLASDNNNWLTVMGRSTNGSCSRSNNDRLPVKFGENMNTGCIYKVIYQNQNVISCNIIQEQVMDILNGFNAPLYIGMYGNSDIHNIGDWVKIQQKGEPTKPYSDAASDGGCSSIVLGVDIKIAYANTGSLVNPQPKIIGVLYEYLMSEYIRSSCMGPPCNVQVAHSIQLKTSVTFIDASRPAFPMYAQIPVTKISFPHDFFYPVIAEYSGNHIGISLMGWQFYVAYVLLIAAFRINI